MPKSFAFASARMMALAVAIAGMSSVSAAESLRVCSDPDNLPFSKSEGPSRGLYIDLAELVGRHLGLPVEYVWYLTFNQRRALRNSMDGCDAYFALPASPDYKVAGADRTKPFLDVRYAVVAKPGFRIATMEDLKGRTIGVTFNSPPHVYLSMMEGVTLKSFRTPEEVIAAIESGEAEAGVLWGPLAGYLNQMRYNNAWQLTPVSGKGLGGQIAVAVPKGKEALKAKIDDALIELRPQIEELQKKYGFPVGTPVALDATTSWQAISAHVAAGRSPVARRSQAAGLAPVMNAAASAATTEDLGRYMRRVADTTGVEPFRAMFNSRCAHCHSQNGASPQPERDLRRLSSRYGDNWRDVAKTTITNGRTDYGMPAWGPSLSGEEIDNLLRYLETIQKKPQ